MHADLHVLASGSKANCYVLETPSEAVVIDQGLSFRQFRIGCKTLGIDTGKITAVFVTHEHTDHIRGVPLTAKKLAVPVYTSSGTIPMIEKKDRYNISLRPLQKEISGPAGGFSVTPFPLMHDAADPVGFRFDLDGTSLSICTDTGTVTQHILRHITGSGHLIIEANHDRGMLNSNDTYPPWLKQRISCTERGHLSNTQCLDVLSKVSGRGLRTVVLSHLSEKNNDPKLVRRLVGAGVPSHGLSCEPVIALPNNPFSLLLT